MLFMCQLLISIMFGYNKQFKICFINFWYIESNFEELGKCSLALNMNK